MCTTNLSLHSSTKKLMDASILYSPCMLIQRVMAPHKVLDDVYSSLCIRHVFESNFHSDHFNRQIGQRKLFRCTIIDVGSSIFDRLPLGNTEALQEM